MNHKETSKESEVASYDLTAVKTDTELSEQEMNEMLSESEDGKESVHRKRMRSHPVFRFFLSHFMWFFACAAIFSLCIFCSNRFFVSQDQKQLGVTESGTFDITNEETQEQLTIYEKMYILNQYAEVTDLNYDSTDKHTYGEIHDLFISEITSFFGYMGLPFTVNGVYEMYIYKYLFTDSSNSSRSFTGWVTYINYYGFQVNCVLDFETQKILALGISTDETENNYHDSNAITQLPDYESYIAPLLNYQANTYVGRYSTFQLSEKKSELFAQLSAYDTLLRSYYADDSICYYGYGYEGKSDGSGTQDAESENGVHANLEMSLRPEDSVDLDYNYYFFWPENVTDGQSSIVIEKFETYFCFNRMDSY